MIGPGGDEEETGGRAVWSRRRALVVGGVGLLAACTTTREPSTRKPARKSPSAGPLRGAPGPDLAAANVADFGALGDGATDDTAAIQRALSSVRVGGTVTFPAGLYRVSRGPGGRFLAFRPGTVLAGEGMRASVLKPVDRAGPWRDFLGLDGDEAAGGVVVRDLGFDMNTRTNPVTNDPVASGLSRCVVYCPAGAGSRVLVERCRFVDCSNVNTLYLAGSTVEVSDCAFEGTGAQTSSAWDHSSVYAVARPGGTIRVLRNTFSGTLGSSSSRTAIETHGGQQTVTDNQISAYMVGMNITGIARTATRGVTVRANQMSDVLIGVQLWSRGYTSAGETAAPNAEFTLANNQIVVNNDSWAQAAEPLQAPACGVRFTIAKGAPVRDITVEGNTITYLSSRAQSRAVDYLSAALSYAGPGMVIGLKVVRNVVRGPLSAAFLVDGSAKDVTIEGNTVEGVGSGSAAAVPDAYRSMVAVGGLVEGLTVRGNTLVDSGAALPPARKLSQLPGVVMTGQLDIFSPE